MSSNKLLKQKITETSFITPVLRKNLIKAKLKNKYNLYL